MKFNDKNHSFVTIYSNKRNSCRMLIVEPLGRQYVIPENKNIKIIIEGKSAPDGSFMQWEDFDDFLCLWVMGEAIINIYDGDKELQQDSNNLNNYLINPSYDKKIE